MSELAFAPQPAVARQLAAGIELGDEAFLPTSTGDIAARTKVAEFLATSELAILTTVSESGWPVTHCMHFGSVVGAQGQPVLYVFSKPGTRKLINVSANPRVSLMVYEPHNAANTALVSALQLQGFCTIIENKAEHKYAMECQFGKVGYGFSRLLGLHKQPSLRIDVVRAVWSDASQPHPVTIDYLASPAE